MQLLEDAMRTSFNHTVAPRYSLNRRYLLSPVLSTDRLNTLGWILSSTLTVQSRIWMCLLLLLSLAIRPWSQQPAQNQDLWPREPKRTNSTGIHTSTSFLSSSIPQVGLTPHGAHLRQRRALFPCVQSQKTHAPTSNPRPLELGHCPNKSSTGPTCAKPVDAHQHH